MIELKKSVLVLFFIICFATPAFAVCDYSNLCPPKAKGLASQKGQNISRGLGATLLSEKIAQIKIKSDLKRATKQNFDVSVKSYSFQDFVHGRFKSIVISGKNLNINGAYLTALQLKTLCDFNHVKIDKNSIQFKENMIVGFLVEISDADLTKTMVSSGYLDRLNCVNVEGCGITFFKISGADVEVKNNKLYFTARVTSELLLAKPLDIVIATDLKVEDGRIVFTKVNLGNLVKGVDLSKVGYQLDAMNPLAFSLDVLENKNTKMCIKHVDIIKDRIIISGNIFIPKNVIK